jgi:hypothetical protein
MDCEVCGNVAVQINEDDNLCLKCFNNDKVGYDSETDGYADTIHLCMACGCEADEMYCDDCFKRQRFLCIFDESSTYQLGSYFGKHLLEKYLGYYVSEINFIDFMKQNDFKYNERKGTFKVKINKRRVYEIIGIKI